MSGCRCRSVALVAAMVSVCVGCGARTFDTGADAAAVPDAGVDAGQVDAGAGPSFTGVQVQVTAEPFAVAFSYKGKDLTALSSKGGPAFYLVKDDGTRVTLTGAPKVSQTADAETYTFATSDGRTASVELKPVQEDAVQVRFLVDGKTSSELLGADFGVTADEAFYGLMERTVQGPQDDTWRPGITEGLDLRGQEVELYLRWTLSVYSPFYVTTQGYGIFVDSDWVGTYNFGKADPAVVSLAYEGRDLTLRVIPGPTPVEAVERYARTIGTTYAVPKFALGPMRWRDESINLPAFYDGTRNETPYNSMVVEDILMMEAYGIPVTLYWIDRPWGKGDYGYDDLEWDEVRLPKPLDMIAWIKAKGINFALWICPWAVGKMADTAVANGWTVKENAMMPPEEAKLLDMTNPDTVSWWQGYLKKRLADGLSGFKLDRGDEKNPDGKIVRGKYHDGRTYREVHNAYPYLYAKAVGEAIDQMNITDRWVMPRAAWKGSQRYATPYGGDSAPTEWGLRYSLIGAQRTAAMNFPVWGTDTCGYDTMGPSFAGHEVCARWLAFSAFTPLMEVGPTHNAAFWSLPPPGSEDTQVGAGGYPYQPYYDEALIAIWIFYANLHHDLADYLFAQVGSAHEKGTPIVRAMGLMHPEVAAYRNLFEQYYLGPDLVVAPIWQQGFAQKDVHIPPGEWVDAWTGTAVTENTVVTADVPEHKVPLYYRKGTRRRDRRPERALGRGAGEGEGQAGPGGAAEGRKVGAGLKPARTGGGTVGAG